jgi:hypothetical protein
VASQFSCQECGQGLDEEKSQKILWIHNWTQTDKKTYIRVLCQKNEGSVELKQRPSKMGGRTTYRTLSPKRVPFLFWIDRWAHLQKVPRRRWISHTYPVWLWGCSSLRFRHLGQFFMELREYMTPP